MKTHYSFLLAILTFLLCSTNQLTGQKYIDKVVAKIGGEHLLFSEIIANYNFQKESNPELPTGAICGITEQLIAQKMLVNQAKLDSIEVSDDQVDAQIDYRIDNILRMMEGDESKFEEYYNKTVRQVKADMRDDMKSQILAESVQQRLISEVTITPKEVVEYYNSIPQDSLPYLNSEVQLSEIIYKPKINEVERQKALDKIEEIREQIVLGEASFEEMAQKYSMDGSAANGGDLGFAKRGAYVPEFEASAYTLSKGELSEVVETEFGFHILRLKDRRGNNVRVQHILIRPQITQADIDLARNFIDSIRTRIVEDSLDFTLAVRLYSDDKSQSYFNGGLLQNPKTGDSYFETDELPFNIYFEIEELGVADITPPIEEESPSGETVFQLIRVNSKTEPHQANLEQDYSRIQLFAKESKKSEYYNSWVTEHLEETFIEVEPELANCPNLQQWLKDGITKP